MTKIGKKMYIMGTLQLFGVDQKYLNKKRARECDMSMYILGRRFVELHFNISMMGDGH